MNDDDNIPVCWNCLRHGIAVEEIATSQLKKKKLCFIDLTDHDSAFLCSCCYNYLRKEKNEYADYWPAMMRKFLSFVRSPNIVGPSFEERWRMVPSLWRQWWSSSFQVQLARLEGEVEPAFRDVSEELSSFEQALEKLEWLKLAENMDKHCAYPEVRCPFGCSEFLHKTNKVSFEDFLWKCSNYESFGYMKPKAKMWVDSISPSYPSTAKILHRFPCAPCVVIEDDGPMILMCREHTRHSTEAYLHVPESPTGTIYTPKANAFSPVVIRPRTNRNFKRNVRSDTYCTVEQVGGYSGVDSCYVTTSNVLRADGLSSKRDALSIAGRPDIKAHLFDRCSDNSDPSFIPRRMIDDILRNAEREYPAPLDTLREWKSSSHIDCETALLLQEKTYDESSSTIRVYDKDNETRFEDKLFVPPWPLYQVFIHPTDNYGRRFERVMERQFDLWKLLCITGLVGELWESIVRCVRDNKSWHGHWLRFACLRLQLKGASQRCKVFPKLKPNQILRVFEKAFGTSLGTILRDHRQTAKLFEDCPEVLVMDGLSPIEDQLFIGDIEKKNIIISIDPLPWFQPPAEFELRCLLSSSDPAARNTFEIYVKHAGKKMWYQRGTDCCRQWQGDSPSSESWEHARIAVFCRRTTINGARLVRRYLSVIGGQTTTYCAMHNCPLIVNHKKKERNRHSRECVCTVSNTFQRCRQYASHICPYYDACGTAICLDHEKRAKDTCVGESPETVFYLSRSSEDYRDLICSDSGGIRYEPNNHFAPVQPAALGPTAAHEIPRDMMLEDEDDDSSDGDSDFQVPELFGRDLDNEFDEAEGRAANEHDAEGIVVDLNEIPQNNEEDPHAMVTDDEDSDDGIDDDGSFDHDGHDDPEQMDFFDEMRNDEVEGDDPPVFESDEVLRDEEDHFNMDGITSTRNGEENPTIEVEQEYAPGSSVPLYVMLNMQGHLLTRSRSKLRMGKARRALFEKIVARSNSNVVPLIYAEAQLFPSIFWQSLEDGTIPGAIPTALWCDAKKLKSLGIATLRQQSKQRITNPALLTSVDPAYHFQLMDINMNLSLRGKDTRIVLNRGFADQQGSDGIKFREKSDNAELYGESSENHANVHKLCSLVRESKPHFFFTQSCNQESCCGLRVLRKWVTSNEAISLMQKQYELTHNEAERFLRESAASYILRSWIEVADLWMKYIIYSPEQPLEGIEWAWYRKEFQEKQGNPFHIHAMLRTIIDISTPDGLRKVLSKIRGCVADILHTMEARQLQKDGFISSAEHLVEILNMAKAFLTHRCHERCQIPKRDASGDTVYICKVHDNFLKTYSPTMHTMQEVQVVHTPEAKAIYNRLGFMRGDVPNDEILKNEKHVPISSVFDPKFSPTNGVLFILYPSSQNLQFTTGTCIAAYLVKYVSGLDEVAIVIVGPRKKNDENKASATVESLKNTKITSNKIIAEKKKKKAKNSGRILTQMECLTVVLGAPLVTSTVEFIQQPTAPREYRAAFELSKKTMNFDRVNDFLDGGLVRAQEVRKQLGFPDYRLFSNFQIGVLLDEKDSQLSMDAVTIFSIRPPELRFVNSVRLYLRWFERVPLSDAKPKSMEEYLDEMRKRLSKRNLMESEWIDGMDKRLLLRRGAINEIVEYIADRSLCPLKLFGGSIWLQRETKKLFELIKLRYDEFELGIVSGRRGTTSATSQWQYQLLCRKFLSESKSRKLPIVWNTPVYPKNKGRFFTYLLLLFGRFETEYELMLQGNMKRAFIHAGLFDPDSPQQSFDDLVTRYIRECLCYTPGSEYQRDRNLTFADSALKELLLDETEECISMATPCVLQSHMVQATNEKVKASWNEKMTGFIDSLFEDLTNSGFSAEELPDKDVLLRMHTFHNESSNSRLPIAYQFPPLYKEQGPQSRQSYDEQRAVLVNAKNTIARYRSGAAHKNIIICGGPGNGKTTVSNEVCMYAFSQGLSGMVTSIVADRSKTLGGIHIHMLGSIPISERNKISPGRAAETAIAAMYRKPELLYLWQRLDFLFIDEFGAVSAELFATIDIIVRHVKESNAFFGGMLLISSMDPRQLLPVTGLPLMMSMSIITEFTFTELRESVRAANDKNLQRICELSRTLTWTDELKAEFKNKIKENCKFVSSFEDPRIPEDAIFVFGRKKPCNVVEDSILRRIRNSGAQVVCVESFDEESSIAGNWKIASSPATTELSKRIKEKRELYLFEKGRYEFTYNLNGSFQQGQLAILLDLDEGAVRQRQD